MINWLYEYDFTDYHEIHSVFIILTLIIKSIKFLKSLYEVFNYERYTDEIEFGILISEDQFEYYLYIFHLSARATL